MSLLVLHGMYCSLLLCSKTRQHHYNPYMTLVFKIMIVVSTNWDKSTCVVVRDVVRDTSHRRCLLLQRHLVQSLRPTPQRGRRGQWPRQWPSWRWSPWRTSPKPQPHSRSHSSQSLNLLSLKVNVVVSCSYYAVSHLDWSCENCT